MTNVHITSLDDDRKRSVRRRKRRYQRVRGADGKFHNVYRLDVASDDFGLQFAMVFQSAVSKARRENKKVLGATDVEPE